jgi:hypothetical protein
MSFNSKRFGVALIFGILSGVLCYLGGIYLVGIENNPTNFLWVTLNRTMIGFVIGISILRLPWLIHGALIGGTVGLLFPYNIFMRGGKIQLVVAAYVTSILFGILIEFFTSIIFKARQTEKMIA